MVQITGTFRYYDGKFDRTITYADGPQSFDPSLEARLVADGTAKYVSADVPTSAPAEETPAKDYHDMTMKELKAFAEEIGVEKVNTYKKKADLLAAVEAEEEPPVFDA